MFFDSRNGDRQYNADDFREWLSAFFDNGVVSGELFVSATDTMTVTVQGGHATINGAMMDNKDPYELEIEAADDTYDRIDNIVVEFNNTEEVRDVLLKVVKGETGELPEPVAPVRTDYVYQLIIARVKVKAGATVIKQSDIEDTRGYKNICGMIVNQKSTEVADEVYKQAAAKTEEFYGRNFTEYNEWFAGIKETFEGDVAAEFNAQVDNLNTRNEELRRKQIDEGNLVNSDISRFDNVLQEKTGLRAETCGGSGSALYWIDDKRVREIILFLSVSGIGSSEGKTVAVITTPNGLPEEGSDQAVHFTVTYMTKNYAFNVLKTEGDFDERTNDELHMVKLDCMLNFNRQEKYVGGLSTYGCISFKEPIISNSSVKSIGKQISANPRISIDASVIIYSNNR